MTSPLELAAESSAKYGTPSAVRSFLRAGDHGARGVPTAVGFTAAALGSLLAARVLAGPLNDAFTRLVPLPLARQDVTEMATIPNAQIRIYAMAVLVVLAGLALYTIGASLARRSAVATWGIAVAATTASVVAGFVQSQFIGTAVVCLIAPVAVTLGSQPVGSSSAPRELQRPSRRAASPDLYSILGQSISLAWGSWITTFTKPAALTIAVEMAVLVFSAWRVSRLLPRVATLGALRSEAIAGLPFCFLPIAGLARAPRLSCVVASLVAYCAFRIFLGISLAASRAVRRLPSGIGAIAAASATFAIYIIPHKFRELPRINHNFHEAGQYAWLNSIFEGKLAMADTATVYGPLREYVLAALVAISGVTAEHVRLCQIIINLVCAVLLLTMSWRLGGRKVSSLLLAAFLILVGTYALTWLDPVNQITFGWADLGRVAFPTAALLGCMESAESSPVVPSRRNAAVLAMWGAALALGSLYSQDVGFCALGAAGLAATFDAFARRDAPRRSRIMGALVRGGAILAGVLAMFGLFVLVYALFGKAGLLARTFFVTTSLFASGSYGALTFPLDGQSFISLAALRSGMRMGGYAFEYALPPMIYAVAAASLFAAFFRRTWTARQTTELALVAYGLTVFRLAMGRSDYLHLTAVTLPAIYLVISFITTVSRAFAQRRSSSAIESAGRALVRLTLPVAVVGGAFNLSGMAMTFEGRTSAILKGTEVPSSGHRYEYPDIPRAGDVLLSSEDAELVRAIRANSEPGDTIYNNFGFTDGGEVYFLANRRNPTRFDLGCEIATTGLREEALATLTKTPPKLVMMPHEQTPWGSDWGVPWPELHAYLIRGWRPLGEYGGIKIRVRK